MNSFVEIKEQILKTFQELFAQRNNKKEKPAQPKSPKHK